MAGSPLSVGTVLCLGQPPGDQTGMESAAAQGGPWEPRRAADPTSPAVTPVGWAVPSYRGQTPGQQGREWLQAQKGKCW